MLLLRPRDTLCFFLRWKYLDDWQKSCSGIQLPKAPKKNDEDKRKRTRKRRQDRTKIAEGRHKGIRFSIANLIRKLPVCAERKSILHHVLFKELMAIA